MFKYYDDLIQNEERLSLSRERVQTEPNEMKDQIEKKLMTSIKNDSSDVSENKLHNFRSNSTKQLSIN